MDYLTPNKQLYGLPGSAEDFRGMPYRRLGRSGLKASVVGLGTWKFGLPETGDGSRVDEETAFEIFDRAWETGVTFWDTANRYNESSGNSERLIGRWLAENPALRRDIVLATKMRGLMDGTTPNHAGLSRQNIMDAVYASLERLQTDHIDLLYFHRPDDEAEAEESIAAVDDLIRGDMVRYFAVSNCDIAHFEAYDAARKSEGSIRTRIVAVQNGFDILRGEHKAECGMLELCAQRGVSYIAWSPLAEGLLTGRYNNPGKVKKGDRLYDQKSALYQDAGLQKKLAVLAELAAGLDISMTRLVLGYMLTLPGMTHVIPAASTVAQLEDNAQAGKLTLDGETRERIRTALEG
ncbi:MAG: aldo/keto reductase [Clostridiaceae bacterium]|nr:aldo/keto reductase [Clostridiaceae bacterium]